MANEPDINTIPDIAEKLEELGHDPRLIELGTTLASFNIFDAIGVRNQELKHSNFLAYLLDPYQKHGLSDYFLQQFLKRSLMESEDSGQATFDLGKMDLSSTKVTRERPHNIDIFMLNDKYKLAVIIENKVFSGEHDDQLERYWNEVKRDYPTFEIRGLFLTPGGIAPEIDEDRERYISIGYEMICDLLDETRIAKSSILGEELRTLILHYTQMVRRHILEDSPEKIKCQELYDDHKLAMDFIIENIDDDRAARKKILEDLIENENIFLIVHSLPGGVFFVLKKWEQYTALKTGEETRLPDNHKLVFLFQNERSSVRLVFRMLSTSIDMQTKANSMINGHAVFNGKIKEPDKHRDEIQLFSMPFLKGKEYEDYSIEDCKEHIERVWSGFLKEKLPKINTAVEQVNWER